MKNKLKVITLIVIAFLAVPFASQFISQVGASDTLITYYPYSSHVAQILLSHISPPNDATNVSDASAAYTFAEGTYVTRVKFWVALYGSPTDGRIGLQVRNATAGKPQATVVETSPNSYTFDTLNATFRLLEFNLSGTTLYTGNIAFCVYQSEGITTAAGSKGFYIGTGVEGNSQLVGYYRGQSDWYITSGLGANFADIVVYIYGNSFVVPTPSPTPTPMPSALSFTLDMRGVGSVTNPSSTTSALGKEWFPKQGLGYTFNGHVWNYTNPYCNGAWTAYATLQRHKTLGNSTTDSWNDLAADDVTEVTSGAVSNGYFSLPISCQTQYNSIEIYQGFRINGTVTGSSATFTQDFLVRWVEQGVIIVEPTESGILPTPTPVDYQPTSYGYIVWYIVALIVVLLPAGVLGVLFRFGAWGFIIGLAIGAGLGYMLMPAIVPLWLVFVVVIGIVGMLLKGTIMGGGSQGTEP